MSYTDDPLRDYDNWEMEQSRKLAKLPRCADCGEPIQSEYYYEINDECICPDCLESNYRKETEYYIE